ncbi:MAG: hypothetical protein H7Y33_10810 [Cytophagales bacterium]|nr:hypothetical protein [Rhizobacter sp.]
MAAASVAAHVQGVSHVPFTNSRQQQESGCCAMSAGVNLWLAAAVVAATVIIQWVLLRARYLKGLSLQRARHAQHQQATNQQIEQSKRQIAQLRIDLSTARAQLVRNAAKERPLSPQRPRPSVAPAHQLNDAPPTRSTLPIDGFADTLPTPQFPHDPALLIRR